MTTVYLTAQLPDNATTILKQAGLSVHGYMGQGLISHDQLLQEVPNVDILITALSTQVDAAVIAAAPHLKLIANFGVGFNNIDTKAAAARHIPVTNTPYVSTTSTAELTVGLILAVTHRIAEGDHVMRTTGFKGWAPLYFLGHQLAGKTLGIIGMGQIGQAVAKRMHAFAMPIIYTQRHQLDSATEAELSARFVSFDELIQTADVITIHTPLTPATHHMLGADQFKAMKKTAYFINAARGPLIDEQALLTALQEHELAGAALDVYEHEPNVEAGFKMMPNVVLTPHIGNATVEARTAMAKIVADNAVKVAQGQAPDYIVNQ
ncbi:glyoxylate reductase [Lactobacillus selangorensis]|uniref:Glyoxylate reductase n=1 Tax=Lactobacillus selangorensis TaxID=81857 RepID=A0A0R2FM78_9LACO|nr:2-hydroxyacid dehydrogenase family protein [Lactobacillus selangorensis]KRN28811.1 glyoxylate reductase [Lactobacillus selangorensis]KRN32779.1 glyoxylate reductase [Lactobacillus selangorensis]